jgi:hypothetical protein
MQPLTPPGFVALHDYTTREELIIRAASITSVTSMADGVRFSRLVSAGDVIDVVESLAEVEAAVAAAETT